MLAGEYEMKIDDHRSITVTATTDRATVVLAVEDPASVAIVELTQHELGQLVDVLEGLRRADA